jgi:hypothetical protein
MTPSIFAGWCKLMNKLFVSLLAAATSLTASSAALAQWSWRAAGTPNAANAEGLRVEGSVPCSVVEGGKTYLGSVSEGACWFVNDQLAKRSALAPNYAFLVGSGVTLRRVARPIFGIPRGAVRAESGESGPVLCFTRNGLGWLNRTTDGCRVHSKGSDLASTVDVSIFVLSPANSFVSLPPLWRDLNTTGGSSGNAGYCRASITSSGAKMAPGVYSDANGGTCHFVSGVSSSGDVIFAKTSDKSRYLVLFRSTNASERLFTWGVDSNARLRSGIVGSEHAYACSKDNAKGIYFRNACVAPPAAGNGAAVVLSGSVSDASGGVSLLSVFDQR